LEEYKQYEEIFESRVKYQQWFEKNEKQFTSIYIGENKDEEKTNVLKIFLSKLKNVTLRFDSSEYREKSWFLKELFNNLGFHNSSEGHDGCFWVERRDSSVNKVDELFSLSFRNLNKDIEIETLKKKIVSEWLEENVWFWWNNEENDKIWKWYQENINNKLK